MNDNAIAIFGSGRIKAESPDYKRAERLGYLLAKRGFTICNGGYGGIMKAASKGANQAGGQVVAVTCSAFESTTPNHYFTRQINTKSLDERLDTLIRIARAYIVCAGGTGTLLELAKVWELKNKGFLNQDKPVILMGDFWKPLMSLISGNDPASSRYVESIDNPEQVLDVLVEYFG